MCSEKMVDMISIFLNLVRLVLWPSMLSILDNIPCTIEKNEHFCLFWNGMFHIYLLSSSDLICHLKPVFPC